MSLIRHAISAVDVNPKSLNHSSAEWIKEYLSTLFLLHTDESPALRWSHLWFDSSKTRSDEVKRLQELQNRLQDAAGEESSCKNNNARLRQLNFAEFCRELDTLVGMHAVQGEGKEVGRGTQCEWSKWSESVWRAMDTPGLAQYVWQQNCTDLKFSKGLSAEKVTDLGLNAELLNYFLVFTTASIGLQGIAKTTSPQHGEQQEQQTVKHQEKDLEEEASWIKDLERRAAEFKEHGVQVRWVDFGTVNEEETRGVQIGSQEHTGGNFVGNSILRQGWGFKAPPLPRLSPGGFSSFDLWRSLEKSAVKSEFMVKTSSRSSQVCSIDLHPVMLLRNEQKLTGETETVDESADLGSSHIASGHTRRHRAKVEVSDVLNLEAVRNFYKDSGEALLVQASRLKGTQFEVQKRLSVSERSSSGNGADFQALQDSSVKSPSRRNVNSKHCKERDPTEDSGKERRSLSEENRFFFLTVLEILQANELVAVVKLAREMAKNCTAVLLPVTKQIGILLLLPDEPNLILPLATGLKGRDSLGSGRALPWLNIDSRDAAKSDSSLHHPKERVISLQPCKGMILAVPKRDGGEELVGYSKSELVSTSILDGEESRCPFDGFSKTKVESDGLMAKFEKQLEARTRDICIRPVQASSVNASKRLAGVVERAPNCRSFLQFPPMDSREAGLFLRSIPETVQKHLTASSDAAMAVVDFARVLVQQARTALLVLQVSPDSFASLSGDRSLTEGDEDLALSVHSGGRVEMQSREKLMCKVLDDVVERAAKEGQFCKRATRAESVELELEKHFLTLYTLDARDAFVEKYYGLEAAGKGLTQEEKDAKVKQVELQIAFGLECLSAHEGKVPIPPRCFEIIEAMHELLEEIQLEIPGGMGANLNEWFEAHFASGYKHIPRIMAAVCQRWTPEAGPSDIQASISLSKSGSSKRLVADSATSRPADGPANAKHIRDERRMLTSRAGQGTARLEVRKGIWPALPKPPNHGKMSKTMQIRSSSVSKVATEGRLKRKETIFGSWSGLGSSDSGARTSGDSGIKRSKLSGKGLDGRADSRIRSEALLLEGIRIGSSQGARILQLQCGGRTKVGVTTSSTHESAGRTESRAPPTKSNTVEFQAGLIGSESKANDVLEATQEKTRSTTRERMVENRESLKMAEVTVECNDISMFARYRDGLRNDVTENSEKKGSEGGMHNGVMNRLKEDFRAADFGESQESFGEVRLFGGTSAFEAIKNIVPPTTMSGATGYAFAEEYYGSQDVPEEFVPATTPKKKRRVSHLLDLGAEETKQEGWMVKMHEGNGSREARGLEKAQPSVQSREYEQGNALSQQRNGGETTERAGRENDDEAVPNTPESQQGELGAFGRGEVAVRDHVKTSLAEIFRKVEGEGKKRTGVDEKGDTTVSDAKIEESSVLRLAWVPDDIVEDLSSKKLPLDDSKASAHLDADRQEEKERPGGDEGKMERSLQRFPQVYDGKAEFEEGKEESGDGGRTQMISSTAIVCYEGNSAESPSPLEHTLNPCEEEGDLPTTVYGRRTRGTGRSGGRGGVGKGGGPIKHRNEKEGVKEGEKQSAEPFPLFGGLRKSQRAAERRERELVLEMAKMEAEIKAMDGQPAKRRRRGGNRKNADSKNAQNTGATRQNESEGEGKVRTERKRGRGWRNALPLVSTSNGLEMVLLSQNEQTQGVREGAIVGGTAIGDEMAEEGQEHLPNVKKTRRGSKPTKNSVNIRESRESEERARRSIPGKRRTRGSGKAFSTKRRDIEEVSERDKAVRKLPDVTSVGERPAEVRDAYIDEKDRGLTRLHGQAGKDAIWEFPALKQNGEEAIELAQEIYGSRGNEGTVALGLIALPASSSPAQITEDQGREKTTAAEGEQELASPYGALDFECRDVPLAISSAIGREREGVGEREESSGKKTLPPGIHDSAAEDSPAISEGKIHPLSLPAAVCEWESEEVPISSGSVGARGEGGRRLTEETQPQTSSEKEPMQAQPLHWGGALQKYNSMQSLCKMSVFSNIASHFLELCESNGVEEHVADRALLSTLFREGISSAGGSQETLEAVLSVSMQAVSGREERRALVAAGSTLSLRGGGGSRRGT